MSQWLQGAIVGCIVGGVISYVAIATLAPQPLAQLVRQGGYEYINPLISCDLYENSPYAGFGTLRGALNGEINTLKESGTVKRISVYFRDMDNGVWTGVNEDDTYIPASLGKVPLLITILKQEQTDANLDTTKLAFTSSSTDAYPPHYPPSVPLRLGNSYSVHDLLSSMIVQSDNNAADLLTTVASTSVLADVYSNFGVPPPDDPNANTISPKLYARFFRILYNASYLGRARSQAALKLLSASEFADGIVAGVPTGTPVSHKFGERTINDSQGVLTNELHDCGIVYYPGHPYGICVMTEGADMDKLAKSIADISRIVYQSVSDGLLDNLGRGNQAE